MFLDVRDAKLVAGGLWRELVSDRDNVRRHESLVAVLTGILDSLSFAAEATLQKSPELRTSCLLPPKFQLHLEYSIRTDHAIERSFATSAKAES